MKRVNSPAQVGRAWVMDEDCKLNRGVFWSSTGERIGTNHASKTGSGTAVMLEPLGMTAGTLARKLNRAQRAGLFKELLELRSTSGTVGRAGYVTLTPHLAQAIAQRGHALGRPVRDLRSGRLIGI